MEAGGLETLVIHRGKDHESNVVLHHETRAVVNRVRVGPGTPLTLLVRLLGAVVGTDLKTARACAGRGPGGRRELILADMTELETHLRMEQG